MFIFIRLVLAHLIGDFLFQFDIVHALKVKNKMGLLLHVSIVVASLIVIMSPYLSQPHVLLFIAFIGITHYIQDWAKIKYSEHSNKEFIPFCLDQIVHIGFISLVLLTDLRAIGPSLNPNHHIALDLYNSNIVILYFITAIVASYAGHFMIVLIKKDYLNIDRPYSTFEKWYGFMERILIVSAFFFGNAWLPLIPFIITTRPILYRIMMDRLNLSDQFSSKSEIILSGIMSLMSGLIFYSII